MNKYFFYFVAGVDNEVLPSNQVVGVVGFPASLECDVRSAIEHGDQLLLVLWYKEGQASPIYTFDARDGGSLTSSRHYSDDTVLAQRGRMKVTSQKAILTIDPVRREDSGTFKCRTDFKKSPTKNSIINLTVLVPPNKPIVRDANGRRMVGRLGPFKVGDQLIATCITSGGNPTPKVTWWRENELIDESFEVNSGHTTNTLKLDDVVSKEDLNTVFTCQAVNNNRSVPVSTSLRLDITSITNGFSFSTGDACNCGLNQASEGIYYAHEVVDGVVVHVPPVDVRILENKGRPLSNGKETHLRCVSTGSRPMPVFRWFVGGRELIDEAMTVEQNLDTLVSHSEISYLPKSSENGKTIVCRATNEYFPDHPKEDSYVLNVHYVPIAIVSFGPSLDPDNIREGDDVYFECHVKTNPKFYNITWRLNGKFLLESIPEGIIIGNQTLVLQNVQLEHAGLFTCIASNSEGDGESNAQYLNVKYPSGNRRIVDIPSEHFSSDHDQSILNYSSDYIKELEGPAEEEDVVSPRNSILRNDISGYIFCWAVNSVGEQRLPCKFEVVKESRPDSPRHCRVQNVTWESARVECRSGFDGGHPPMYILEVSRIALESDTQPKIVYNLSNLYQPAFELTNLTPGTSYSLRAYTSNNLGRSTVRELNITTLNPAEKRIAEMKSKPSLINVLLSENKDNSGDSILPLEGLGDDQAIIESQEPQIGLTWLAILCGVCVGLGLLSFVIILLVRNRIRRQNLNVHHRRSSSTGSGASLNDRRYDAVSTNTPEKLDCALRTFSRQPHQQKRGMEYGARRLSDCTSSITSKNESKTCSSIIELPSYDATFVDQVTDKKITSVGGHEVVSLIDDSNLPLPPATFCDFPPSALTNYMSTSSGVSDSTLLVQNRNEEGSVKQSNLCNKTIDNNLKIQFWTAQRLRAHFNASDDLALEGVLCLSTLLSLTLSFPELNPLDYFLWSYDENITNMASHNTKVSLRPPSAE
ncbi:unnamed protein product [Lepeophtheirus salmonis]|uniref:(salmon louse) hypothetical protein n=1 Tax=Lepeophtheirus salmonis TaxID=72036 RepID=A0A7R8H5X4_LEPSM|nr:unnamed protein product [Lepeophtheirus salmonis]CAF2875152.1 unnamed protein product [Lepeophtheirus salmonis]